MARRLGKYKLTKKNIALSSVAGGQGVVDGNLTVSNAFDVTGATTLRGSTISGATTLTSGQAITGMRRKTITLTDKATSGAHTALTAEQSGAIILVPHLTEGAQTIQLPNAADAVGCTYTFVAMGIIGQDFDVVTNGSEKILGATPDGAGDNAAASDANNSMGFDENAVRGSRFTITGISTTAGIAFIAHDLLDGLAANTGGLNLK